MFDTSRDFGFVLFHFLKSTDKGQVYVTATVYKTLLMCIYVQSFAGGVLRWKGF